MAHQPLARPLVFRQVLDAGFSRGIPAQIGQRAVLAQGRLGADAFSRGCRGAMDHERGFDEFASAAGRDGHVLDGLVDEMEKRFSQFEGVQDLKKYNAESSHPLPRIVCICDEYADLILPDSKRGKEVERRIARIGAM